MSSVFSLQGCLVLSAALFATGVYGVLAQRNLLIVLLSVEVMLNAVNLALVAFTRQAAAFPSSMVDGAAASGQVFVLMSMAVAAAEVAVGLSLLIALFRHRHSVDSTTISLLEG